MSPADLSRILRDAAERVENGWCQGREENEFGGVCAARAIDVSTSSGTPFEKRREAWEAFAKFLKLDFSSLTSAIGARAAIVVWNDSRVRTKKSVVRALRGAADALEA